MSKPPLTSPHDQGATFVELFFDLVFVFAISRLTHHFAHHIAWSAVLPTLVVGWLLWWAWTQYTWALNAANTNRHAVRGVTLLATGFAFLMATWIEPAFEEGRHGAFWFAITYAGLRILGLVLYDRVASQEPEIRRGVRIFALASVGGLAMVIAGSHAAPPTRYWMWGGAMLLDVGAAWMGGRHQDWHLRIEHFAERHGLILIIALGEALIVAGVGVADKERTAALVAEGVLAAATTCLLWWTYFGWAKDAMEHGTMQAGPDRQVGIARDTYTLWHFPLVAGVMGFAAGLVELMHHPYGATPAPAAYAMAAGLVMFVGSTAMALQRATGVLTGPRLIILATTVLGLVASAARPAWLVLAIASLGLAAIIAVEHLRPPSCKLAAARERQHTS